jgi:hypothetical protein
MCCCFFVFVFFLLQVPPDLLVGAFAGAIAGTIYLTPLSSFHGLSATSRRKVLGISTTVAVILTGFILMQFPYDNEHPKRLNIQHIERKWFECAEPTSTALTPMKTINSDAGLWVLPMDYLDLAPLSNYIPLNPEHIPRHDKCLLCSFPWYFPIDFGFSAGWFMPAPAPKELSNTTLASPLALTVTKQHRWKVTRSVEGSNQNFVRRKMWFHVTGPTHMGMVIPTNNTLVDWSLGRTMVEDGEHAVEFPSSVRPVYRPLSDSYFVFRATGNNTIPWEFTLTFETPEGSNRNVQLFVFGHLVEYRSDLTSKLEASLPDWVTCVSYVSEWHSYCFA